MFIDEGFGSLDSESLAQAIKVLSQLSQGNKLIGIISHIDELKEKIDKQIQITKNHEKGSTAKNPYLTRVLAPFFYKAKKNFNFFSKKVLTFVSKFYIIIYVVKRQQRNTVH